VIILDTNVLSALMRAGPDPAVVAWLDRQPAESVWITSITLFETRFGLALLPSGRRRRALEAAFGRLLNEDLENRVLDFDSGAANAAALLAAARQKMGQPIDMRDQAQSADRSHLSSLASLFWRLRRATRREARRFRGIDSLVYHAAV
jgi:toxin FitB